MQGKLYVIYLVLEFLEQLTAGTEREGAIFLFLVEALLCWPLCSLHEHAQVKVAGTF